MNQRKIWGTLIGVSLFFGVMIGWVAPLAIPPIAQVAQPIVCPDGELGQDVIRGESVDEVTYNSAFQCYRGDSDTGEDVTTSAILTAIGIYSLITFVLLFALGFRALRSYSTRMRTALQAMDAPGVTMTGRNIDMRGATLDTKLRVLAELRTQGLIDETRYEAMVAEARAKG